MFGLSSSGKTKIKQAIEDMFDSLALKLIGNHPKLQNRKVAIFSSENHYGLANLFIQALGNRKLNTVENDFLRGLLDSSYGYVESLKNKTMSNIAEKIDGIAQEAKLRGTRVSNEEINETLQKELDKSKSHLIKITEAEGTKVRNMGATVEIGRMASELKDEDPNVYFVVKRDAHTCQDCIRNHLHPDGTPKIFKLSEVKYTYLSSAERKSGLVSICGAHPHCRCSLSYLAKNFTFKNNKLAYHSEDHDEYTFQKEKYKK